MGATKKDKNTSSTLSGRMGDYLERHSRAVIIAAIVVTLLLIIPLLTMKSDEQASQDPSGEVFELRDDINERFATNIHGAGYIVESRTGDMLTQAALLEFYQNEQKLREIDEEGGLAPEALEKQPYLYTTYYVEIGKSYTGVYTIADAVQEVLAVSNTSLENATDEQVKMAVHRLFADEATSGLRETLSDKAVSEKRDIGGVVIDYWIAPALNFGVLADNDKLGGGTLEIGTGGDERVLNKEEFNRNVQSLLRGDEQTYQLWGIGIDVNLEAMDEGQTAGFFIMFTVIAVVLVAGVSLRSYWAVALTGAGLGILMIWLKGISNLVGIKGGLIVDMIVPIALISLGVDFALHALRRYGEEKERGYNPSMALRMGFAGVLGALTLAMASDGIAFLSNASSGIESVIQFGIGAGIAVVASFLVLGIVIPLAMKHVDQFLHLSPASSSKRARLTRVLNSVGVAVLAGTGVIFLVAVSEVLGLVVLFGAILVFLIIPLLIIHWRRDQSTTGPVPDQPDISVLPPKSPGGWFVNLVAGLAHYRLVVLMIVIALTTAATILAMRLEATFEVKDFFDSNSDLAISLDKLDEHMSESGGEPGTVYIKGDLTDPDAIKTIDTFLDDLDNNDCVAKQSDGGAQIWSSGVIDLLTHITGSDYARNQVYGVEAVEITDNDGDGFPDSREQIKAIYNYVLVYGVPLDESTLVYTPSGAGERLYHKSDGSEEDVTTLSIGILGTGEQQHVVEARISLTTEMEVLNDCQSITRVGLTGSPFTRLGQLEATTDTLQRSLPIAAIAVLIFLLIVMRSFRYTIVTIIPIGLVVAWLYGLMYLTGFAFNYVTAVIGAVSLGVGIDYSIHMTERFREEMGRASSKMQALRQAASGTGVALLASAASSIVGFAIMGFAPMPMFSSYGMLTAIMIFLALTASLAVLPSLLLLVTPEKKAEKASEESGA